MKEKDNRCIDCSYLTLEGDCTNIETTKDLRGMFKRSSNRIIHPEVSWCVNIEIKKEKERKQNDKD